MSRFHQKVSIRNLPCRSPCGWWLVLALLAFSGCNATEAVRQPPFEVETVVSGLEHPWGMAFLPNGDILVTERPGRLRVIGAGRLAPEPVNGLPAIATGGQGGLMDVALHPDFEQNRLVYLSFSANMPGGRGTRVARGRFDGHSIGEVETIFSATPGFGGGRHFGSRLLFGADGYLYVTLGERGHRPNGQDLGTHPGSVVRIRDDGGVPADNPLLRRPAALPEIYSYGNRNVQGIALQPGSGRIWMHEHGPQGGDELNVLKAGANYGWPAVTYGRNYVTGTRIGEGTTRADVEPPIYYWVPSIAPSGMAFYDGDKFPQWQGDLFIGSLKFELLVRLQLDDTGVSSEQRLLEGEYGRIRDVRSGPDGYLYLLTDERNGELLRLVPVSR